MRKSTGPSWKECRSDTGGRTPTSLASLRGSERIPLCRLHYERLRALLRITIYSAAHDIYLDAIQVIGLPIGTPQEALDTASTVHLAGLGHEPAT